MLVLKGDEMKEIKGDYCQINWLEKMATTLIN